MRAEIVSTDSLSFLKNENKFVGDMSDIHDPKKPFPYRFYLKSAKTGEKVEFVYMEKEVDSEGDIISFKYLPLANDLVKFPKLRFTTVILYND